MPEGEQQAVLELEEGDRPVFWLTDGARCSCPDHTRRRVDCKHMRAYRAAQPPVTAAPVPSTRDPRAAEYDRIFGTE